MNSILDRIFPPFSDAAREKPRDMLFVAHETPGMGTTIVTGTQHALVILMFMVYVVVVGREIGLPETELRGNISLQIVILGVGTVLQCLTTRFSSGHMVINSPSLISASVFVAVATTHGLAATAGGLILSGLIVIMLARLPPKLRSVFPPEVSGVLLLLLGLSLVQGGIRRFTGFDGESFSMASVAVASAVLATIVILSIWAAANVRFFAMALGVLAGLIVAFITGQFGGEQMILVAEQPVISFPFAGYELPTPTLVVSAALSLIIIEVISAVSNIGKGVVIDKMNNDNWRRPDLPMISRLVGCHGIGVVLHGIAGTMPSTVSSANIGLAHATGVAARRVGVAGGIILIISAFMPAVSTFITQIPQPVMGAIIIYTTGFMMVAGMQLIMSRMINNRRMFMIGLSTTVGAAIILMPELTADLSDHLKPILGSGLTMGVLTAIVLNAIFRIGVSQTGAVELAGHYSGPQATSFLENCGMDWGARPDVIARAGMAVGEALEALHSAKLLNGKPTLRATFDEYKLIVGLEYPGKAITFAADAEVDLQAFMDDEESGDAALDAAMSNMSGLLIRNLADRVSSDEEDERANLLLEFTH